MQSLGVSLSPAFTFAVLESVGMWMPQCKEHYRGLEEVTHRLPGILLNDLFILFPLIL